MKLIPLEQLAQLAEIVTHSEASPVLIFKHSTRCSISVMAWGRLQRQWTDSLQNISVYYLDLLNHRDISAEIAALFQIEHQSPQALLIRNGVCQYNASHSEIDVLSIQEKITSS
jgi:bacillithiol system protein YtxJ